MEDQRMLKLLELYEHRWRVVYERINTESNYAFLYETMQLLRRRHDDKKYILVTV
jgi:hypothetical protein